MSESYKSDCQKPSTKKPLRSDVWLKPNQSHQNHQK